MTRHQRNANENKNEIEIPTRFKFRSLLIPVIGNDVSQWNCHTLQVRRQNGKAFKKKIQHLGNKMAIF